MKVKFDKKGRLVIKGDKEDLAVLFYYLDPSAKSVYDCSHDLYNIKVPSLQKFNDTSIEIWDVILERLENDQ